MKKLFIDTGANVSFIDRELAVKYGAKETDSKLDVTGWVLGDYALKEFSLGIFGVVKKTEGTAGGVLGADFFASRIVRFSFKSKTLWVKEK